MDHPKAMGLVIRTSCLPKVYLDVQLTLKKLKNRGKSFKVSLALFGGQNKKCGYSHKTTGEEKGH